MFRLFCGSLGVKMSDAEQRIIVELQPLKPNLLGTAILVTVPILILILAQRPELRQRIIMRSSKLAAKTCFDLGEFFHGMGLRASTVYQKARLL
jgi:hypothetical protein